MSEFGSGTDGLQVEQVACNQLAAEFGTPLYVYSRGAIERAWRSFDDALSNRPHLICYAMKANSNLAVLNILARLGSGFDIVSEGELQRVIAAGGDPAKVVFSGVGKTRDEMAAAMAAKIRCFNVESLSEIKVLAEVAAAHGVVAPVSVRVNPDVDAMTHPYISTGLRDNKFGIAAEEALQAYQSIADSQHLQVVGMDCHIGSQLTDISPYLDALQRLLGLCDALAEIGIGIEHLDLGGGQGIRYRDEQPMDLAQWAKEIDHLLADRDFEILVEPGRSIVGNAGLLLTRVSYLKHSPHKNFAIVDAAMNDLIRPSLYSAWQEITEVKAQAGQAARTYDVVGPVCETGDFLGRDRQLAIAEGDVLAVMSAGAYGFCMSSNYNSRPRAAEVLVDGDVAHLVRARESVAMLFEGESILPEASTAKR